MNIMVFVLLVCMVVLTVSIAQFVSFVILDIYTKGCVYSSALKDGSVILILLFQFVWNVWMDV